METSCDEVYRIPRLLYSIIVATRVRIAPNIYPKITKHGTGTSPPPLPLPLPAAIRSLSDRRSARRGFGFVGLSRMNSLSLSYDIYICIYSLYSVTIRI